MQSSEVNLVNFKMLFEEKQVDDLGHPNFEEYKLRWGQAPKKHVVLLKLDTLAKHTPFATVFSVRGWREYEKVFFENLPKEYKVIYKSELCANATHSYEGRCQYIVVVDKNENP